MTPEQTKRQIEVMAKHGEPGWRIEVKTYLGWQIGNPDWEAYLVYRAVRVETVPGKRVPLPWSTIRCGMVVRNVESREFLVTFVNRADFLIGVVESLGIKLVKFADITELEYLDGTEWKPLWTEEPGGEKIVEIISEEEE